MSIWGGSSSTSFPVESDEHLYTVLRYVERNPVRANLVDRAEGWRWPSGCRARWWWTKPTPTSLRQNLLGGARYLNEMLRRFGSYELAFAAYNAGPGKVTELGRAPKFKQTIRHWKEARAEIKRNGGWPAVTADGEPKVIFADPNPPTPLPTEQVPPVTQAPPGQGVSQALAQQALLSASGPQQGSPSGPIPDAPAPLPVPGGLPRATPGAPRQQVATSPQTQINSVGQALLKKMLGGP